MKGSCLAILLLCLVGIPAVAQTKTYHTRVDNKQIKTLQVKVAGELISNPCIELGGDKQIEINFDALHSEGGRYAYTLTHCNADWTRSTLSPIEFLNGFQGLTVDDFANSMNTTVHYTNYRLLFPNEDIQPKVSGNYALTVYPEENPSQIAFTACFSVVEPMVAVAASVSGNTDIDTNQSHQQVSFAINHKNYPIPYPQTDLKIWVYQDNRRDNAVGNLQPTTLVENQLIYSNNRNLIFKAGNEYRRMEFLSKQNNGMHVEHIAFHNPYYNVELMKDYNRSRQSYQYDQDQDGRFFIRCSHCSDSDTEADYYIVHFALASDPLPAGNLYLNGQLTQNAFNEQSRMEYNPTTQQYEKSLLLKQGSYNYQYLFVPEGEAAGQTAPVEGNYFQAENEYSIYVYYRPMGTRYDRLIGMNTVRNAIQLF